MKKTNLVNYTDLLFYAVEIGYEWNQANAIMVQDGVPPMYEIHSRDYHLEYLDEYLNPKSESFKIVNGFMEKNGVSEITVIRN